MAERITKQTSRIEADLSTLLPNEWAITKALAIYSSLLEGNEKTGETKRVFNLYPEGHETIGVTITVDGTIEVGEAFPTV